MTVVNINRRKKRAYKIEGEGFERIRRSEQEYQNLITECNKKAAKLEDLIKITNEERWQLIQKEAGIPNYKGDLTLDISLEDYGIYIVKKKDEDVHPLQSLLEGIIHE